MSARPHITSSFKEGGTTVEIRVFAAKGTNVQELLNVLFDEYVHVVGQIQDKWGSKETMT